MCGTWFGGRRLLVTVVGLFVAAGCHGPKQKPVVIDEDDGGEADGAPPEPDGTSDDADDAGPAPVDEIHVEAMQQAAAEGMTTSTVCSQCHSNSPNASAMHDASGREIGFFNLWQASMKANAARDPFWRAMVSAETAATPSASDDIEKECMRCHSPVGYTAAERRGEEMNLEMLDKSGDLGHLTRDGVSCTLCHQSNPENFGEESSFGGHYKVHDKGEIYGPHEDPLTHPMERHTGYTPTYSEHIREPGLCATCHTLNTTPMKPSGEEVSGHSFPEQSPYLEWQNSKYGQPGGTEQSCQDCHVPQTDRNGRPMSTRIARNPHGRDFPQIEERSPIGRHLFVGGNTLVPQMLRDHADELNPQASKEAFNRMIETVRRQLRERTADVTLPTTRVDGDQLTVEVEVRNRTGHKFPTGFPSRRAWLHLRVTDADDRVLFESGGWDDRGRIVGPDDSPLSAEQVGGTPAPHHATIEEEGEVQIFEAVMKGIDDEPTYRLLRAKAYRKDNRLLPAGWSDDYADLDRIEPVGTGEDDDFGPAGDQITYRVSLPDDSPARPLTVEAELVYQPVSARFAAELFEYHTRPVRVFESYWRQADPTPEMVDEATAEVE